MSDKPDAGRKIVGLIVLAMGALAVGVAVKTLIILAVIIAFVALFAYIFGNAFVDQNNKTMQDLESI